MLKHPDHLLAGIIVGAVVPFVGYAIFLMIYDQMELMGWISDEGMSPNFRERTIGLLSIALNMIFFQIYNRKYYINTMRGMIFPTVVYVGIWLYLYLGDVIT